MKAEHEPKLEDLLGDVGQRHELPPGWQADVWKRIERKPRRRRWWMLAPAVAFAAAAAVTLLWLRSPAPTEAARLAVVVQRGDAAMRAADDAHYMPGDVATIRAHNGGAAHWQLRLYFAGRSLLLACPGSPQCDERSGGVEARLRLTAPGRYRVLWITGPQPIPPPVDADGDVGRADELGLDVQWRELVVR